MANWPYPREAVDDDLDGSDNEAEHAPRRPAEAAPLYFAAEDGEALGVYDRLALIIARRRRGHRGDAFGREAEGLAPTDDLPWGDGGHPLGAPRLLTIDDPRAPDPPGFKGNLYPPQATLLHAMLTLERRPLLRAEDPRCPLAWEAQLQTKCARVSERFSFGKTVLALALVCAQTAPALLPELVPLPTYALCGGAAIRENRASITCAPPRGNYDPVGVGFLPELTIRYQRYLPLTVVVAAASVISQWEDNARRFTSLRFFVIENVRSLRAFEQKYCAGQAAEIDLLFVKAGRVTAGFVVAGEAKPAGQPKNRSLFEALGRVLDGVPVARLVVDDFDTLKLGSDDCFFPALFTWLLSATRRRTAAKVTLSGPAATVETFLRGNMATSFPICGAALDDILNHAFSLHCAPAYVDAHLNATVVGYRRVFVRGGWAGAILRALEVPAEVIEMVNGDAVCTAAQSLGLAARNSADVIRRVVGAHLEKLGLATRALARVARARAALRGGPAGKDGERPPLAEGALGAKELRAALKDGSDEEAAAALAAASGSGQDVAASLASLEKWASEQKEKYGQALARMRDNIREKHCQCCMVPFAPRESADAEAAYILAGCCQIIVCEPCITKTAGVGPARWAGPMGLPLQGEAQVAKRSFIQRCPNCARDVKLETGLIRVGAELDLESALKDEVLFEPAVEEPAPLDPARPPADPVAALDNPKLKALIQLVTGRPLDCVRDCATPPYVSGLLHGRRDSPWPGGQARKYLIFAMHGESTRLISDTMTRLGVPHCVLRGPRAQKDEAVRLLREAVGVMLVTAPKDCAGLDLPFLSHVVFYHAVLDRNIEAQVAARGQRLGRQYNLEILALVNEAEAESLGAP